MTPKPGKALLQLVPQHSCSSLHPVFLLWQSYGSAQSNHFPSVCYCSLKLQMELVVAFDKVFNQLYCLLCTSSLKSSTTGCINYTLGGIIHLMIEYIHLVVRSIPCIGHLFNNLLYLSHALKRLSSPPCLNTLFLLSSQKLELEEKICSYMPPLTLPSYSLIPLVMSQTKLLPHLSVKRGRASA